MGHKPPFFSIIIPTYNRPALVSTCLRSLTRLDFPRNRFEVIIVDDGSQTPPEEVVTSFYNQLDLTLLTQPHAGPATARNYGAMQAKGEFLAFTDDDCAPLPDWLHALAARVGEAPDCAIGGRTLNGLSDNPYATASQSLIDYLYVYCNGDPNQARFLASNNLAVPASGFNAMGGFDTTFTRAAGEDRDFCDRWVSQGHQLIYAPEVQVCHAHRLAFTTFWWQHFNYGRAAFRFHRNRTRRGQGPVKLEPFSFYSNLLKYSFSLSFTGQTLRVAMLFVVSQLANATGYFRERINETLGGRHIPQ